jgi:hypothetical protein
MISLSFYEYPENMNAKCIENSEALTFKGCPFYYISK